MRKLVLLMPRNTHPRSKKSKSAQSSIPVAITSFIGREREITRLKRLLGKTRLLTLTGAGGSGKTRLALEFASFFSDKNVFRDGVWWVPLAFLSDPELVPQTVASTLGLPEIPNETFTETLVRSLKDKHLLLVLDNCEHLVGRCAKLANQLLSRCPDLKIVTTSREALGLVAEQIFQVPFSPSPIPNYP